MNAPGDFYVENGCCTACDLPRVEAPDLFMYDDDNHCYICKQPSSDEEVVRILNAMDVQELDCIQYKGRDQKILAGLEERNLNHCTSSNLQVFWAKVKAKLGKS